MIITCLRRWQRACVLGWASHLNYYHYFHDYYCYYDRDPRPPAAAAVGRGMFLCSVRASPPPYEYNIQTIEPLRRIVTLKRFFPLLYFHIFIFHTHTPTSAPSSSPRTSNTRNKIFRIAGAGTANTGKNPPRHQNDGHTKYKLHDDKTDRRALACHCEKFEIQKFLRTHSSVPSRSERKPNVSSRSRRRS